MKIAYRIMACRQRQMIVEREIAALAGEDVKVFYDDRPDSERKGTYYTQLKCIYDAISGEYSHLCILQDDLKLVNDFGACMNELAKRHPEKLWTLFCPRLKAEDASFEEPYAILKPANTWGPGNMIPMDMLRKIMTFREERLPNYIYDDGLYFMYCLDKGIPCYTTRVALLQHLCPTASMLGYNSKRKVSKVWKGADVHDKINWDSSMMKRYNFPTSANLEVEYAKYGPRP